jgi:two-component sensor histidine kinase
MDRIPAIKRGIVRERTFLASAAWTVLAVALPIGLRWAIDRGQGGIEFVTIFPAVVLAALFLGWRAGAVVALAAGMIANRLFRHEPVLFYADGRDALMTGLYALTCAVLVWAGATARRLVRDQQAAAEREALLNHELMHRVKNLLATVNALATLTARHSSPAEFPRAFSGRMRALERATDLLAGGGVTRCDIEQLVTDALAPFHSDGRFAVEGPACELPSDSCVPLALALHELCTNAAKYGALSTPEGKVSLVWTVGEGKDGLLRVAWRESGGPPVSPPTRRGMGTQLLRAQRGLDHVELDFQPHGLRCEIHVGRAQPAAA